MPFAEFLFVYLFWIDLGLNGYGFISVWIFSSADVVLIISHWREFCSEPVCALVLLAILTCLSHEIT